MVDTTRARTRRSGRREVRPALARDTIVDAAVDLIDQRGVEALSMRNLGAALGYEGMSLYRHVDGRDDLLEAVVDRLTDSLDLPNEPPPWEEYLTDVAAQLRELALKHPRIFPLVATRHPAAPWLHPPLRSLRVVEHLLRTLRAQGWDPGAAVQAYQAFSSFLLGYLLLEVAAQGEGTAPPEARLDEGTDEDDDLAAPGTGRDRDVDVQNYPTITELRPVLERADTTTEFNAGLTALLHRLAHLAPG
ncbi:TetR/AcrR family transcriptional regulator [Ornithinimicrobium cerasi]|uniref:TetR/AcrR family transcriptional regulator n=1 Tax=Ornithinimicrobium cerasi TaxID=2248773 RepID=UPI00137B85BF|nr:TetR family transcriptional regulator [Ornithinimicrobium cerasi]